MHEVGVRVLSFEDAASRWERRSKVENKWRMLEAVQQSTLRGLAVLPSQNMQRQIEWHAANTPPTRFPHVGYKLRVPHSVESVAVDVL